MQNLGTDRIRQVLEDNHLETEIITFDQSTRTAHEAATALKCEVGQIAKSLVFRRSGSDEAVLIITSGKNRVDPKVFMNNTGVGLDKADARFCETITGYVIGGIPPFGHRTSLTTYIDQDLLDYEVIWASAGGPNSVFRLNPTKLPGLTNGHLVRVC